MSKTFATLAARYNQFAPDPELHGSYYPTDIYPGEAISATIRAHDSLEPIATELRVWRLSPLGLEILLDSTKPDLSIGQVVDIDLQIGSSATTLSGLSVIKSTNDLGRTIVGIRLVELNHSDFEGVDRRRRRRWSCGSQFEPVCVAMNPARFNDLMYFRVKDISHDGMKLYTSLRNKFLVKGMRLECIASFPLISQLTIEATIENVHLATENGKDYLAVGVKMGRLTPPERQAIGQYLIQFGTDVSVESLRHEEMVPWSISPALEFSFVRTLGEYKQVLELRHLAYRFAGKIPEHFLPEDMGDIYDTRSRIVIGKHRGQVVATAGLVFNEYHDRMEIEERVNWPGHLPRRDQMVEVIRNCTHPAFRGSDLLMAMFQFIAITVLQAKRNYVVIGCTPDLVGLYSRIGMEKLDIDYHHGKLNDSLHTVMLGDIPKAISGASVNPLFWNAVWAPTAAFMIDSDLLELSQGDRTRMNLYRLFRPLSLLLQRRMKRPRNQQPTPK
jgi:hypothetical protein